VQGLFSHRAFTGFGPSRFAPPGGPAELEGVRSGSAAGLRARVRIICPPLPGVYGMVDDRGDLIYVGKSRSLRSRLLSYFRTRSRDPKAGRIIGQTRVIAWETAPTEFSALLRELELIRRWRPRFNVEGQPGRARRTLVCLGRRPGPHAFVSRKRTASADYTFGPVPAGSQAREAVRRINDWFGLRDCPQSQKMIFRDQQELFPILRAAGCIRHEIGNCLGPCAAACSHAEYEERLQAARAFLEGNDRSPLDSLERDMLAASAALEYERAAALRDRFRPLQWLSRSLDRLRQARSQSFVYPLQGQEGKDLWYVVHRGFVRAVLPDPADPNGAETVQTAAGIFGERLGNHKEIVDVVLLVDAWFRKHPEERRRTLSPEQALGLVSGSVGY
jgi:excinuclease ABC subunit C